MNITRASVPDGLEARSRDECRLPSVPLDFGTVGESRCMPSGFRSPSYPGLALLIPLSHFCLSTLCTSIDNLKLAGRLSASGMLLQHACHVKAQLLSVATELELRLQCHFPFLPSMQLFTYSTEICFLFLVVQRSMEMIPSNSAETDSRQNRSASLFLFFGQSILS